MFSIANLLDRAKAQANIESDYRLAKVLRINQSALSNYRHGRALPGVEMIESLCALSGDDAGLMVAQVEAARAADGPVRNMWLSVAARLRGAASTAILSVCFAIALIAFPASDARAVTVDAYKTGSVNLLYIVESTIFTVGDFLRVRLRRWAGVFRLGLCASW
jgi:transcriptional regulator with XRE-family HTH domain